MGLASYVIFIMLSAGKPTKRKKDRAWENRRNSDIAYLRKINVIYPPINGSWGRMKLTEYRKINLVRDAIETARTMVETGDVTAEQESFVLNIQEWSKKFKKATEANAHPTETPKRRAIAVRATAPQGARILRGALIEDKPVNSAFQVVHASERRVVDEQVEQPGPGCERGYMIHTSGDEIRLMKAILEGILTVSKTTLDPIQIYINSVSHPRP